ncbi:MAG: isoprenyl transferase [Candidatus Omnitrophota bacterium]
MRRKVGQQNIPVHVAIIMDGNGRWARKHRRPRSEGHRRGMAMVREVIKAAADAGVKFLTIYAFSSENWKRPKDEVGFLMQMCEDMIGAELPYLLKNRIRLRHIGRLSDLPSSLQRTIAEAQSATAGFERLSVQLAFNYGARQELLEAVRHIIADVQRDNIQASRIDEQTFSKYLTTRDIPDPDLLIRTSGEQRISNFLLWQSCYSELYFTKTLWPDFNKREFWRALKDYQSRKRRFGGLDD